MSYLRFVECQRKIIRDTNFKGVKMTRNYLDILFFIYEKRSVTISQISRELLHTNYINTYQIICNMQKLGLIKYFRFNENRGKANWILLSDEAKIYITQISFDYRLHDID
jgi:DNA-binding MarR family transcriptional regulator